MRHKCSVSRGVKRMCATCMHTHYANEQGLMVTSARLICKMPLSVYPTPRGHRQRDWTLPQARARSSYHAQRNLSVSFRQLLRCSEKDRFRSCHHVHVQRLEVRHVRLEFLLCFRDVDHFCVHSPLAPGIVMWVFISSCSGRDPGN